MKVGDTVSDIKEGVNAGVWSVGVIVGSSEMGLSLEEFTGLAQADKEAEITRVAQTFIENDADFTIKTMGELPQLIETINELIAIGKKPGHQ